MKNLPVVHMFPILSKIESNYNDARESHLKQKSRRTIQICSESMVGEKGEKKGQNKRKLISCSDRMYYTKEKESFHAGMHSMLKWWTSGYRGK